jgi:glycosyltransferase involved in cell wall biosynthesis
MNKENSFARGSVNNHMLSIIIPVFNRSAEIRRAVASCLWQEDSPLEVIVVDDGSTDDTADAVMSIDDVRLRLVRMPQNRGQGAARNRGIKEANGEWLVFLDSDDELLPGAIRRMRTLVGEWENRVDRIAFSYLRDDGRVSPLPEALDTVLEYHQYLAWLEGRKLFDFLACARRQTCQALHWPEGRWSDNCLYNIEFAFRFRTLFLKETLAMVHTDAPGRMSWMRRSVPAAVESAHKLKEEMDMILAGHGRALQQHAPGTWQMFERMRASYAFLSGRRNEALRYWLRCCKTTPLLPEIWMMLALGLAGRGAYAAVRSFRRPST